MLQACEKSSWANASDQLLQVETPDSQQCENTKGGEVQVISHVQSLPEACGLSLDQKAETKGSSLKAESRSPSPVRRIVAMSLLPELQAAQVQNYNEALLQTLPEHVRSTVSPALPPIGQIEDVIAPCRHWLMHCVHEAKWYGPDLEAISSQRNQAQ